MVFSFFSRKSKSNQPVAGPAPSTSSSPTPFTFPNVNPTQLHTPAPSISFAAGSFNIQASSADRFPSNTPPPPPTPSPPPSTYTLITDPTALHTLISSVPAQTLHSYCLKYLNPSTFEGKSSSVSPSKLKSDATIRDDLIQEEASPTPFQILTTLTSFFSSLVPPPQRHCVRCHKFYFELDNTDTSCRVQHDDDSAIVDRVRGNGTGDKKATYETLWGCCEKVVEGDGDQGPPDGWCYEGRHTTDTKRARFRTDSTPHDDKLASCTQMRCFAPPLSHSSRSSRSGVKRKRLAASPTRSRSRAAARKHEEDEDETNEQMNGDEEDARSNASGSVKRRRKSSTNTKKAQHETVEEDAMDVDGDNDASPKDTRCSPPVSPRTKTKAKSKPKSRAATSATAATTTPKKSPLSASFIAPTGPNREPSPSPIRPLKAYVEIRHSKSPTRPPFNLKGKGSVGSLKDGVVEEIHVETDDAPSINITKRKRLSGKAKDSDVESVVGKEKKKTTVKEKERGRKGRGKMLDEVVDTSVDAEKW